MKMIELRLPLHESQLINQGFTARLGSLSLPSSPGSPLSQRWYTELWGRLVPFLRVSAMVPARTLPHLDYSALPCPILSVTVLLGPFGHNEPTNLANCWSRNGRLMVNSDQPAGHSTHPKQQNQLDQRINCQDHHPSASVSFSGLGPLDCQ